MTPTTRMLGAVTALTVGVGLMATPTSPTAHAAASVADEFSGPAGSRVNRSIWGYDVGGGGWGNNERQIYTNAAKNSRLDGKGNLVIEARKSGNTITSARLSTGGKFSFITGTLSARIQVPTGKGLHPAFWLLGSDVDRVGYPAAGEIDVMEFINEGASWHSALHGPTISGKHWQKTDSGRFWGDPGDGFHTYSVHRGPGVIAMAIDNRIVSVYTPSTIPSKARWVFDKPMHVILNLAVGGRWPGAVSEATDFPARMVVDWVRYTP
ncbi:glycoside hydrolase family 16 protein [Gordonia sp. CPCC 206044]|uniref:glycoside hydrolase family 16 protein n=1 Tax=Gordonia sp. CPCC 206044 TaxID=3140793 RepID=UPI003AF3501C